MPIRWTSRPAIDQARAGTEDARDRSGIRGGRRVRGKPVRAPSAGARAGNVVHVFDCCAETGERPVIRPDHGRIQIVRNESRAGANCRHAGSGFLPGAAIQSKRAYMYSAPFDCFIHVETLLSLAFHPLALFVQNVENGCMRHLGKPTIAFQARVLLRKSLVAYVRYLF